MRVPASFTARVPKSSAIEETSACARNRTLTPRSEHPVNASAGASIHITCTRGYRLRMRGIRLPQPRARPKWLLAAPAAVSPTARARDADHGTRLEIHLDLAGQPFDAPARASPHPVLARRPGIAPRQTVRAARAPIRDDRDPGSRQQLDLAHHAVPSPPAPTPPAATPDAGRAHAQRVGVLERFDRGVARVRHVGLHRAGAVPSRPRAVAAR